MVRRAPLDPSGCTIGVRSKTSHNDNSYCIASSRACIDHSIEVILIQPPHLLEVKSSGDTVGNGKMVLEQRAEGTAVTYYWDVATSNPVFNLLGKLSFVRAMIENNHAYVMDDGYRALKQRVER